MICCLAIFGGDKKMIGLDFVKHIDKDWKKHVTYVDGTPYSEDYCPLSGGKCRQEDCVFWDDTLNSCGYLYQRESTIPTISNEFPELIRPLIKPR